MGWWGGGVDSLEENGLSKVAQYLSKQCSLGMNSMREGRWGEGRGGFSLLETNTDGALGNKRQRAWSCCLLPAEAIIPARTSHAGATEPGVSPSLHVSFSLNLEMFDLRLVSNHHPLFWRCRFGRQWWWWWW